MKLIVQHRLIPFASEVPLPYKHPPRGSLSKRHWIEVPWIAQEAEGGIRLSGWLDPLHSHC